MEMAVRMVVTKEEKGKGGRGMWAMVLCWIGRDGTGRDWRGLDWRGSRGISCWLVG